MFLSDPSLLPFNHMKMYTEEDDKRKTFKRQQTFQRSSRTIPFPFPINEKLVKASYKDGLLQITVPKQKGKPIYLD